MNESFSHIEGLTDLCAEKDTFGFDLNAGQRWIYPTNYPVRDYQFNITQKALYHNTMVCLPTGLGKTFIAAVVMYNFYRWYPTGKIIFMAPTKPLVAQQLDACYNVVAIPENITAEITGTKVIASRANIWKEKRVFFITPQILQNDIDSVLDLAPQIRCIVIDEAHKALGKHANCEAIKKIYNINTNFRVLALSATPGSNFNAVRDVITNLLISHIEVRTNESIDVAPYVFQRKLDTIVIPITGKLLEVKNEFIKILDTYTRPLINHNIFNGNCATFTKGRIVLTMKEFKEKGRGNSNYNFILRNLNICITLYHGYELLIRHGLRGFLTFFDANMSKPLLSSMQELHAILEDVTRYLGPVPEVDMLPDGTIPELQGDTVFSHPKFHKLSEILLDHFTKIQDTDTRIMVFCEYRESVMEIYTMLLRHRPLVKPRIFLGQGAISQAQQIQTVRMFKSGACNTLVSTCIGEEGLDVGEVDLIVCFDISSKSPIRMVQRMGRTGRKRDGRVVVLVTQGKEQQLLKDCLAQKQCMISLLESAPIKSFLYKNNPRMIPECCKPECSKMFITVQQKESNKVRRAKKTEKKNTLKSMFANITCLQASSKSSTKIDIVEDPTEMADFINTSVKSPVKGKSKSPVKKSGIATKKGTTKVGTSKSYDIRNMFSKLNNTQSTTTTSTTTTEDSMELSAVTSYEPESENVDLKLKSLIVDIRSYLSMNVNNSACLLCDNLFNCRDIRRKLPASATTDDGTTDWNLPDASILDRITSTALQQFTDSFEMSKTNVPLRLALDNNKMDTLEKSLNYFHLDSITDIFSDDSTEIMADTFVQNPIVFTQSLGVFNSPNKMAECLDDIILESDTEQSPTISSINKVLSFKTKSQRRLFSQSSSTPNVDPATNLARFNSDNTGSTPKRQARITEKSRRLNAAPNVGEDLNTNLRKDSSHLFKYGIVDVDDVKTSLNDDTDELKSSIACCSALEQNIVETSVTESKTPGNQYVVCNNVAMAGCQISPIHRNIPNEHNATKDPVVKDKEDFQIWDESIFESSDIEEQSNSKSPDLLNLSVHNTAVIIDVWDDNKNKMEPGDNSFDSDRTMLSFDETEFESAKSVGCNFETNLSKCNAAQANDKSANVCNKLEGTLLSVTQMIDLLNKSKANDSLLKLGINSTINNSTINTNNRIESPNIVKKAEYNDSDSQKCIIVNSDNSNSSLTKEAILTGSENVENIKKNMWISPNKSQNLWISPKGTQRLGSTPKSQKNPITASNAHKIPISTQNLTKSPIKAPEIDIVGISKKLKQNLHASKDFDRWTSTIKDNIKYTSKIESPNISVTPTYDQNTDTSNRYSADISPKNNNNSNLFASSTKENSNFSFAEQQKPTRSQELDVRYLLKDIHFSDDSDEEQSLLSFSQNSRKNRHKKIKLQLNSTQNKPSTECQEQPVTLSQNSPLKLPQKKMLNCKKSIEISDSDDDFEMKSTWVKPATKCAPNKVSNRSKSATTYSAMEVKGIQRMGDKAKSRSQSETTGTLRTNKKTKNRICEFLDLEAEVEMDEHFVPDSQNTQESDDLLESSFIDNTQSICDQSNMHAIYLQSIKSQKFGNGAFKIPSERKVYEDVFSQEVDDENDTYINDSFCVGNDVTLSQRNQMSYLEVAEAELERRRKAKKRKRIVRMSDSD